jgi:hypothetical protein
VPVIRWKRCRKILTPNGQRKGRVRALVAKVPLLGMASSPIQALEMIIV